MDLERQMEIRPATLRIGASQVRDAADGIKRTLDERDWLSSDEFGSDLFGMVVGRLHVRWLGPYLDDLRRRAIALHAHADGLQEMITTNASTEHRNVEETPRIARA